MKYVIEENIAGAWLVMKDEGLCNPYDNPEFAWRDFKYITQTSKTPDMYRLTIDTTNAE